MRGWPQAANVRASSAPYPTLSMALCSAPGATTGKPVPHANAAMQDKAAEVDGRAIGALSGARHGAHALSATRDDGQKQATADVARVRLDYVVPMSSNFMTSLCAIRRSKTAESSDLVCNVRQHERSESMSVKPISTPPHR